MDTAWNEKRETSQRTNTNRKIANLLKETSNKSINTSEQSEHLMAPAKAPFVFLNPSLKFYSADTNKRMRMFFSQTADRFST